ncbi:hypothetical protein MSAN_00299000 [Mycena sanguinolenta]|uniref:Hydrophobin n=1 Tax=Mycena sanguinolenta TaxID=230812 RepID=A0A8H7DI87_9AGAR|nr:hypothetical protein MSAN_00299000 [Mycena sanguinolenta]
MLLKLSILAAAMSMAISVADAANACCQYNLVGDEELIAALNALNIRVPSDANIGYNCVVMPTYDSPCDGTVYCQSASLPDLGLELFGDGIIGLPVDIDGCAYN